MRKLIEYVGCKTAAGLFHRLGSRIGRWETAARVSHPTPTLRVRRLQRGFTLIELVMVIVVLGIGQSIRLAWIDLEATQSKAYRRL